MSAELAAWARRARDALQPLKDHPVVAPLLEEYPQAAGGWGSVLVALLCVAVIALCVKTLRADPAKGRRARGMSFSSELMAQGGFPEHATMPAHLINAVVYFNDLPTVEAVVAMARDSLLRYPRFSSVPEPAPGGGPWHWRAVPVPAEAHVFHTTAPSAAAAHEALEALIQEPLRDPTAPRWEIHLVENTGEGTSLAIMRIDHCVGDGISLMQVMLGALTDLEGRPLPEPEAFSRREKRPGLSVGLAVRYVGSLVKALALSLGAYDSDIAFTSPAKKTLKYNGKRRVVIVPDMDLEEIKAIKNKAGEGATVNDVMMACTAGAIRRYCARREDPLLQGDDERKAVQVRALLPIAFPRKRGASPGEMLRNLWCFLSAALPVGAPTPQERLREASRTCKALKESPDAPAMMNVVNLTQYLPTAMVRQTSYDLFTRHSVVFSNVPGPSHPVAFAGREIVGVQMVFPSIVTQIGILSCNGRVFMNWVVDPEVVSHPDDLAECFLEELEALKAAFL